MKKFRILSLLAILILALVSCGPSTKGDAITQPPTEMLAPTNPTLTPYDLNAKVTDQAGNPITWATGIIQGSGNNVSSEADETGQLVWKNLPTSESSLNVFAQGYIPVQQPFSLERGPNEITIALERDPYQLDPMTACRPGQRIIFVEDFEDNQAQDLDNLVEPKWSFITLDDRGVVLSVNSPGNSENTKISSEFGNAVWQFDLKSSGMIDIDFNWHVSEVTEGANPGMSRYYVSYQPGVRFELNFERPGESSMLADSESTVFEEDTWHNFAIAYFKGDISVWVDGQMTMNIEHDFPIEKGRFGFQINPATQAEIWFDNLIVCSLKETYTPSIASPR